MFKTESCGTNNGVRATRFVVSVYPLCLLQRADALDDPLAPAVDGRPLAVADAVLEAARLSSTRALGEGTVCVPAFQ